MIPRGAIAWRQPLPKLSLPHVDSSSVASAYGRDNPAESLITLRRVLPKGSATSTHTLLIEPSHDTPDFLYPVIGFGLQDSRPQEGELFSDCSIVQY